jgi:transglutaminase-like putative cysteine protease
VAATLAWLAATGAVAAAVAAQIGGGKAWLNYRAWDVLGPSRTGIAFSWDQTYGPITWSRSQQTMFTVSAPRPQLWKTTMLDRFDGLRFVRSGTDVPNDQDLPLPLNDRWYTFATFTIRGLSSQLLPTEQGTTVGVNIDGVIRHDTDGTTRKMGVALRNGGTYTVLSYVPRPTTSELRAAPRAFPAAYLRYTDFDLPAPNQSGLRLDATGPLRPGLFFTNRTVGTAVPGSSPAAVPDIQRRILASPYGPMYRLARRLALGMHSTYDVATAIEHYLLANYAYGEQPPVRRYPLESFLFVDRVGYCQQFSAAMALMLRMDGIPARVAAGFLPGARTGANGTFDVRAVDAHSWVEVFFTGIGWVPFNPTPPRSLGYVPKFPGYTSERTVYPYAALAATVGGLPQFAREPLPVVRRGGRTGSPGVSRIASIAAILVAVLGTLGLVVRWSSGHARLRRSLAGDGELASVEVARALRRLGYAIPATVTLSQIERLVRLHGGADAARYVQLLRERRYSAGAASAATLRQRRRLRRGLTAHLGLDARLRGLWALPPATIGWRV